MKKKVAPQNMNFSGVHNTRGNHSENPAISAKKRPCLIHILAGALLICILTGVLVGCSSGNDKKIPVYQGMTVSNQAPTGAQEDPSASSSLSADSHQQHPALSSPKSLSINSPIQFLSNGDTDTITQGDAQTESTSAQTEATNAPPDTYSKEPIYFVKQNEDAYISIHIENPDRFEILSFTLNDEKYSSYMFEPGSNMENLILKVNAGAVEGLFEYTIDAIKYVDGSTIKDVKMEGSRTVKLGVYSDKLPTAKFSKIVSDFTAITFDLSLDNRLEALAFSGISVSAVLYCDDTTVAKKPLRLIENKGVSFDNLTPNTNYICSIEVEYDLFDGKGLQKNVLGQKTIRTSQALRFNNVSATKRSASFELVWDENYAQQRQITALALYKNNAKVRDLDISARTVTDLLSDSSYTIVASYQNGDQVATTSTFIHTEALETPIINDVVVSKNHNSITFSVLETDPDNIGAVYSAELYHENDPKKEPLIIENKDTYTFTGLQSSCHYWLKITYSYNLNDGKNNHVISQDFFVTTDFLRPATVNITSVIVEKDSVSFEINENDPDNIGDITKIELIHGSDEPIVAKNVDVRSFTGLKSNTEYMIWVTYTSNLNQGSGDNVSYASKRFTTQAKAVPSLSISSCVSDQDTITFELAEIDTDNVGAITKIELLRENDSPVIADSSDTRSFSNLLSNNYYTVKVTYVYDLNDGTGEHTITKTYTIRTQAKTMPTLSLSSSSSAQDSVDFVLTEIDSDNVGVIVKAELLQNGNLLQTKSPEDALHFEELTPLTEYQLLIYYEYDLNDGNGTQTLTESCYQYSGLNRTQGLRINSSGDVTGIGSCTDTVLYIDGNLKASVFQNNNRIMTVYIGTGVTEIGDYAFYNCERLTNIVIPDTVTSIGSYAFSGCTRITSITIPKGVTQINDHAFSGCARLETVSLPKVLKKIGDSAFRDCNRLTNITLPNGMETIGPNAFYNCSSLTELSLPNTLTKLEPYAFSNCVKLTSITIPNTILEIKLGVFSGCSGLTSIVLHDKLTKIGNYAFNGCSNLTELSLPDSLRYIGTSAFSRCSGLTNIILPKDLIEIGSSAFSNCSGLTTIIIPNGIIQLESYVFQGCTNLESITLSTELFMIGKSAFSGCAKLISINIPDGVTDIEEKAFQNCYELTNVKLPANLYMIGDSAFSGCAKLISIDIPDELFEIGDYAFYECINLTSLFIPNNVSKIGTYAFDKCSGLETISLPAGLSDIEAHAFSNCENLTRFVFRGTQEQWTAITKGVSWDNSTPNYTVECSDGSFTKENV